MVNVPVQVLNGKYAPIMTRIVFILIYFLLSKLEIVANACSCVISMRNWPNSDIFKTALADLRAKDSLRDSLAILSLMLSQICDIAYNNHAVKQDKTY